MRVMRVVCIQNYNLEVEYKISLHQKSLFFCSTLWVLEPYGFESIGDPTISYIYTQCKQCRQYVNRVHRMDQKLSLNGESVSSIAF